MRIRSKCRLQSGTRVAAVAAMALSVGCTAQAGPAPRPAYQFLSETCEDAFDVRATLSIPGAQPQYEARLAFYWQSEKRHDFLILRGGRAAFLRTREGRTRVLAGPAPLSPQAKLPLILKCRPGKAALYSEGRLVLAADLPAESGTGARGGGRIGRQSSGAAAWKEVAYQPVEPPSFADDFMRQATENGEWTPLSGAWRVQGAGDYPRSGEHGLGANPFSYEGRSGAGHPALSTAGCWFWDDYVLEAAVRPNGKGAVGLCAYVQDANSLLLFRWTAGPQGQRQLVRVRGGKETVLASAPGGWEPRQWYRLGLRAAGGRLQALIDGEPDVAADETAFGQGLAALYVGEGSAEFDDVRVTPADAPSTLPGLAAAPVPPVFATDRLMHAWATEEGWWQRSGETFWHCGDFFGDQGLRIPQSYTQAGRLRAVLCGDGQSLDKGYALDVARADDQVRMELRRDGRPVAQVEGPPAEMAPPGPLLYRLEDSRVTASIGGGRALRFEDPQPLAGRRIGIRSEGQFPAVMGASPFSSNLLDCAFAEAPVEFYAQRGEWGVLQRWACWGRSHFGGGDHEAPLAWTKRDFTGDVTVAYYGANGITSQGQGADRWSDLNVTLCGDGRSPASGYSFVVAGWKGSRCALFRQGRQVADAAMPPHQGSMFSDFLPVRVRKQGARLQLYAENALVLDYTDPEPLPGGKVGFWSAGRRSLLMGRVRIWYQQAGPAKLASWMPTEGGEAVAPAVAGAPPIPGEWSTRGDLGGARLSVEGATPAQAKGSLCVVNREWGGPFTVWVTRTAFDAAAKPQIAFDYQVPPGVKVNLYAWVGRGWQEITLTGDLDYPNRKVLGRIEGAAADGEWHHAQFNLLDALRLQRPDAGSWRVRELAFASPDETYLRAGLTGNPKGAAYRIAGFTMDAR